MAELKSSDRVNIMAGVWASADPNNRRWVELSQLGIGVNITVGTSSTVLTVEGARTLARQLYRLARRNEVRDTK